MQQQRKVVVGVGGGIAAYKACHIIRLFKESGDNVIVVPTESALRFVGKATFEALSGNPVSTTVFDAVDEVRHVRVGKEADLVVIAPATADLMARAAGGRADDLLCATLLVATCPVVFAPAMHTEMWEHAATQANVERLRSFGMTVLEPAHGRLTGTDTGPGRLAEPQQIVDMANTLHALRKLPRDLEGRKVLITAGGTQEPLDPVRFLGNHSSGRQGFALAEVAAHRGAQVTLIAAHTDALDTPVGAKVQRVHTAREMQQAVQEELSHHDVLIMAAAVADFRPTTEAGSKLKKGTDDANLMALSLMENPDILRGAVEAAAQMDPRPVIVGFAAETGDEQHSALDFAHAKLAKKGCDLLMLNEVSEGKVFGQDRNRGYLLQKDGAVMEVPDGSKFEVASAILDRTRELLDTVNPATLPN
ncbi:bifunctional phosphopantothenoylcysteine decarboxylase/phosphopantothenate--cysteine ligase CoaBC [Corynebacterium sp. 153RC1]|uniref:bifunctional phosphopantothenoylcysteine decarboxylase/phosphopantothenate--cysteine ligase CoaBC n=1 Tax=Corynebacterium TaxID=1716 RepID=UPI00211CC025|nr:bifunctional phosphopantothenoylcysteine decarboxylase/phosphopantothenate--cysteine ligase CoaBC [Corynebacterium sp. 76QC2CO]MCQ9351452.1 bifunctional phosphopantothenoylcysteine decarboxylase/phosphopantothenate--cysteine ligase CoaBC [Corynebacterium sp. 209RC1]MCQ9354581.1 bifunctional phosphopantothenoylcysteine decarboxylase/phosphopantothenate--cysteine ligase CoaBC [Corynebacterium sp. 1222RC1]MCQ9357362.1 bifunctional phosphopantothenoylcysteine decarboxylase/phosphopantothenate--cy